MITSFLDPAVSATLWITIKASVLLGVAAILQAVMYRRTSAATRHLVWTLASVGVLLLPILTLVLRLTGRMPGDLGIKYGDGTPYELRFELYPHGDKLIGAAVTYAVPAVTARGFRSGWS